MGRGEVAAAAEMAAGLMSERLIEAAGGVLWRPAIGGRGVEVCLIHRPKYDDWSLPKGKLNSGEHVLAAAEREVWEETGHRALIGRPLGEIRYSKDGSPKRVRYWAMRQAGGEFAPNDEVDQVMWLPPREGQIHLLPDRDRSILVRFARDPVDTWPCALVRHASAGERSAWKGADRERPLDDTGVEQAEALIPALSALGIKRVLSADMLRCLETVGPFAERHRLTVESEPLVSETGYSAHPLAAVQRMLAVIGSGEPSVVCSQGKTLPELVAQVCRAFGQPPPADTGIRKAAMVVLHAARDDAGEVRLVALDRFEPPI
jgi:8-oxo-dGTP diphosphatase